MKALTTTILFLTGIISHAWSEPAKADIAQVKISISFKGVDAKWFSALDQGTMSSLRQKDGTVVCPSVTAKSGQQTKVEIIQEYRLDASTLKGPVIPCGIIVDLTPEYDEQGIRITGTTVLRYAPNKSAVGVASRFTAEENLISMKLQDGATKTLDIGGGQMLITASLIDKSGAPIKK
jgi:hypothetical protein